MLYWLSYSGSPEEGKKLCKNRNIIPTRYAISECWFNLNHGIVIDGHGTMSINKTLIYEKEVNRYWSVSKYSTGCSDAQACLTLCDLMDCCPPGSSVHRILPGREFLGEMLGFRSGVRHAQSEPRTTCHSWKPGHHQGSRGGGYRVQCSVLSTFVCVWDSSLLKEEMSWDVRLGGRKENFLVNALQFSLNILNRNANICIPHAISN